MRIHEHNNTLLGLAKLLKVLWSVVDDDKAEQKQKIKAIDLIIRCTDKKLQLLGEEVNINGFKT